MSKDTELLANLLLRLAEITILASDRSETHAAWDAYGNMQELIDEAGRVDE